jgi:hypothetical protein
MCVIVTLAFLLLLVPTTFAQSNKADHPCDKYMKFCWYGPYQDGSDEVDAWGTLWKSDDPTEKSLEQVTEVRCVKKLHICIKARNQKVTFLDSSVTNIDLYNVRSWDNTQIRAVMEEVTVPECEQETLVINRAEQSVLIMSSPGPHGNEKRCTDFMGPPKTVVYRLANPQLEKIESKGKGKPE